eukprot:GEMP01090837.1.p1 GENE.GEMP01090837.1~~GEMP01090837.1.p1  ORF type:complete len:268 (-),score=63.64 GEMP01090837.1:120-890(-)
MPTPSGYISASEVAQYDRQIRLWGLDAQKLLLTSEVVFLSLRGCYVEVVKNLVLAGIGHVRLQCHRPVTKEDLEENYYLREEDIGKPMSDAMIPRLQEMNPFIKITASRTDNLGDVVFTDEASTELHRQCVKEGRAFFLSRSTGEKGFCWIDNGEASLLDALNAEPTNARERQFQEMCKESKWDAALITTNSILGGLVAQDALKVIMKSAALLDNLITFSHYDCATYVDRIPKKAPSNKRLREEAGAVQEEVLDLD